MRALRSLTFALVLAVAGLPASAQEPISNLPRNQTLIVENPEGTIKNAGWFNIWAVNAGGQSTGLHQLDDGHLLVHRSATRPRWRLDELARVRQADLQRRLHRNDGEAAPRHLLERRRRVRVGRRGLHRRAAHEDQRHALERAVPDQRRVSVRSGPQHRRVQAEETEFALSCALHGALECGLDDAEACLREGRRSAEIRLQQADLARRLRAAQLRPERQVVHLADARRLAAHRRSAALASRARNTSPMSIRARPTSA